MVCRLRCFPRSVKRDVDAGEQRFLWPLDGYVISVNTLGVMLKKAGLFTPKDGQSLGVKIVPDPENPEALAWSVVGANSAAPWALSVDHAKRWPVNSEAYKIAAAAAQPWMPGQRDVSVPVKVSDVRCPRRSLDQRLVSYVVKHSIRSSILRKQSGTAATHFSSCLPDHPSVSAPVPILATRQSHRKPRRRSASVRRPSRGSQPRSTISGCVPAASVSRSSQCHAPAHDRIG
jgi:hypothetical protein